MKIQSITARILPRYVRKLAAKQPAVTQAVKKDYTKIDTIDDAIKKQVWDYLHGDRIMHSSPKEPIIELNPVNISEEISDVVLSNITCKIGYGPKAEDIDAAMGRYGLSMYSGIPINEFHLSGGYKETPYEKGKSIAYALRDFLFENREGYVQCIRDRFGKSGKIMLDALEKTGVVHVYEPPMSYGKHYRCCNDFFVDGKRYYGMPMLEKAFQIELETAKK